MSLLNELKRRNVLRVGAAYVVGAWLLIQVTETIFPLFGFGDTPARLVVIVLAIGFIPSLIFTWVFEFTPEGLKKDADVDSEKPITQTTVRKLDRGILVVLALALGYFAFDKFVLDPVENEQIAESARQEGLTAALTESLGDQSIAVLPFDNRSNREEDQFFTDGIHDDLLTTIAKIGSMKVISRTSVMEYKETTKKIPEIAKELGVANILEGGIQRSGNQVRINVQLIDAVSDEHLWAEIYDRELTAENLFAVQSEITRMIADALLTELSTDEQRRIGAIPTDNLLAYEAYMRGNQLMATREVANLHLAVEEFTKATETDPLFALAWVGLAEVNVLLTGWTDAAADDLFPIIEDSIRNALAIDNDLGEAYATLAWVHDYYGRDEEAEAAFQKAIELRPNYATAYQWYGQYINRNYPRRIKEGTDLLQKAAILDPRSLIISLTLAGNYRTRGLYKLAESQYRKLIALNPEFAAGMFGLTGLYLFYTGQFDKALTLANKEIALDPETAHTYIFKGHIFMNLGDLEAVEQVRDKMDSLGAPEWTLGLVDVHISFGKGNKAGTREIINGLLPVIQGYDLPHLIVSPIAMAQGDIQLARELYLSVEPGWLDPEQWPALFDMVDTTKPTACLVAWLFMNTGDQDLGAALVQQAIAYIEGTLPLLTEHPDRNFPDLCYLAAGDTEKALLSIETQLAHNHLIDWYIVHQMPMYDLIRDEPRYQVAWAEHGRRIAVQSEAIDSERQAGK